MCPVSGSRSFRFFLSFLFFLCLLCRSFSLPRRDPSVVTRYRSRDDRGREKKTFRLLLFSSRRTKETQLLIFPLRFPFFFFFWSFPSVLLSLSLSSFFVLFSLSLSLFLLLDRSSLSITFFPVTAFKQRDGLACRLEARDFDPRHTRFQVTRAGRHKLGRLGLSPPE